MLRIAGIVEESIVDGPGIRFVIFTQGCPHGCKGCHNPHSHDFQGGTLYDADDLYQKICRNPLLKGVTFSGGEPFCQPKELVQLADKIRRLGLDLVVYTGYTYEQLQEMACSNEDIGQLLKRTDYLVDGLFIQQLHNPMESFRGSSNQRILCLANQKIVECTNFKDF